MLHVYLIKFRADIFIATRTAEMIHGDIVQTRRDAMINNDPVSKLVSPRFCIEWCLKGFPIKFARAFGTFPAYKTLLWWQRQLTAFAALI